MSEDQAGRPNEGNRLDKEDQEGREGEVEERVNKERVGGSKQEEGGGEASHPGRRQGQGQRGAQEDRCTRRSRQCWYKCRSGKDPPRCTRPRLQDRASETQAHLLLLCLISQATPLQFPQADFPVPKPQRKTSPNLSQAPPFFASPASGQRSFPITTQLFLMHPVSSMIAASRPPKSYTPVSM